MVAPWQRGSWLTWDRDRLRRLRCAERRTCSRHYGCRGTCNEDWIARERIRGWKCRDVQVSRCCGGTMSDVGTEGRARCFVQPGKWRRRHVDRRRQATSEIGAQDHNTCLALHSASEYDPPVSIFLAFSPSAGASLHSPAKGNTRDLLNHSDCHYHSVNPRERS